MDNGSESAKVQRDPCDGSSVRGHQLEVRRFDHDAPAPGDRYGWLTLDELLDMAAACPTSLPLGTTPGPPTNATTHGP